VVGASVTDEIDNQGSPSDHFAACLNLAVQDSQRVGFEPPLAVRAQLRDVLCEELGQLLPVPWPTILTAQAVYLKFYIFQAHLFEEFHQHDHDFPISHGMGYAEDFDIDLIELSIPPLLWAFVSEHGTDEIEFGRGVSCVEVVFEIGPGHGGRGLRAKGEGVAAPVLESIHFLLHDIGRLPDTP